MHQNISAAGLFRPLAALKEREQKGARKRGKGRGDGKEKRRGGKSVK